MIKKFMAALAGPAADRFDRRRPDIRTGSRQLEAVGSLRAVNGADLVAAKQPGIVDDDRLPVRRRCAGRDRFCCGCATTTMSPNCSRLQADGRSRASHLSSATRSNSKSRRISQATVDTDAADSEERPGAGRRSSRRWSTRRLCALRSPAISASAQVDLGPVPGRRDRRW